MAKKFPTGIPEVPGLPNAIETVPSMLDLPSADALDNALVDWDQALPAFGLPTSGDRIAAAEAAQRAKEVARDFSSPIDLTLTGTDQYSLQLFVTKGSQLQFQWRFDAADYLPYDDFVYYSVSPGVTNVELSSVSDVGDFGDSGWHTVSYTAQKTGVCTITLGIQDVLDSQLPSTLYINDLFFG